MKLEDGELYFLKIEANELVDKFYSNYTKGERNAFIEGYIVANMTEYLTKEE